MQLQEHARAILADDALLGIRRKDPVLQRLAKNTPKHADAWHIYFSCSLVFLKLVLLFFCRIDWVAFFLASFVSLGGKCVPDFRSPRNAGAYLCDSRDCGLDHEPPAPHSYRLCPGPG